MVESNDKEASSIRCGWRHYEGSLKCMSCGAEFDDGIMEYLGDDVPVDFMREYIQRDGMSIHDISVINQMYEAYKETKNHEQSAYQI